MNMNLKAWLHLVLAAAVTAFTGGCSSSSNRADAGASGTGGASAGSTGGGAGRGGASAGTNGGTAGSGGTTAGSGGGAGAAGTSGAAGAAGTSGAAGAAGTGGVAGTVGTGGRGGATGGAGGGQACGPNVCGPNQYCCKEACGLCLPMGAACPARVCADAGFNSDAETCIAVPAGDSQCTATTTPHLYTCFLASLPAPCVIHTVGDATDTYCCP
jgi:hypothetical protein